jgi:hypothetical protein
MVAERWSPTTLAGLAARTPLPLPLPLPPVPLNVPVPSRATTGLEPPDPLEEGDEGDEEAGLVLVNVSNLETRARTPRPSEVVDGSGDGGDGNGFESDGIARLKWCRDWALEELRANYLSATARAFLLQTRPRSSRRQATTCSPPSSKHRDAEGARQIEFDERWSREDFGGDQVLDLC